MGFSGHGEGYSEDPQGVIEEFSVSEETDTTEHILFEGPVKPIENARTDLSANRFLGPEDKVRLENDGHALPLAEVKQDIRCMFDVPFEEGTPVLAPESDGALQNSWRIEEIHGDLKAAVIRRGNEERVVLGKELREWNYPALIEAAENLEALVELTKTMQGIEHEEDGDDVMLPVDVATCFEIVRGRDPREIFVPGSTAPKDIPGLIERAWHNIPETYGFRTRVAQLLLEEQLNAARFRRETEGIDVSEIHNIADSPEKPRLLEPRKYARYLLERHLAA